MRIPPSLEQLRQKHEAQVQLNLTPMQIAIMLEILASIPIFRLNPNSLGLHLMNRARLSQTPTRPQTSSSTSTISTAPPATNAATTINSTTRILGQGNTLVIRPFVPSSAIAGSDAIAATVRAPESSPSRPASLSTGTATATSTGPAQPRLLEIRSEINIAGNGNRIYFATPPLNQPSAPGDGELQGMKRARGGDGEGDGDSDAGREGGAKRVASSGSSGSVGSRGSSVDTFPSDWE